MPEWVETEGGEPQLIEDVALLARLPNPFNSDRTLTIFNGVHSRGVFGAVRSLTDASIGESNERFLAERYLGSGFALLMRVKVVAAETLTPDFSNPVVRLYEWSSS